MNNQPKNNIINLCQNIATQTTCSPTQKHEIDYELYEDSVNDIIARIFEEQGNPYFVLNDLATLTNLFLIDVPLGSRANLFRQLNSLVSSLMVPYLQNEAVYQRVHGMMSAFKDQIEKNEQQDEGLAEIEWAEFQKLVYLLTDWEDSISPSPSCNPPT